MGLPHKLLLPQRENNIRQKTTRLPRMQPAHANGENMTRHKPWRWTTRTRRQQENEWKEITIEEHLDWINSLTDPETRKQLSTEPKEEN